MLRILCLSVCVLASVVGQAPTGYYASVDSSSPTALRSSLHRLIDDHQRFRYTSSSTDTWDILEQADQNPQDSREILDVYRNADYRKQGGGNSLYNREHSWPKSYGFPNDNSRNYPYTDCHHLFLSNDSYNSSRSNKPYDRASSSSSEKVTEFNNGWGGGSGAYPGNSNWTSGSSTSGRWETWRERRGDVARALFYLDVRYEGGSHGLTGASEPNLILTDSRNSISSSNTGSNRSVGYMGMLSTLLQWHRDDPVDSVERRRNDVIYAYQGNRNPFIDHPEWVDCVFLGQCSTGGGGTPSGSAWINEFHYDNAGSDTGEFVEFAGTAGTSLSGWQILLYNGNGGRVYGTYNLSGSIANSSNGFGFGGYWTPGIQNGSADGIALVDGQGRVVQFLSYEGRLTATNGPAAGLRSVDIGRSESSSTPVGYSLQLGGTGRRASDFFWQSPRTDTPGARNSGQTLQ